MKPTLSVVMITKNAEKTIIDTLNSIKDWVNEIVIVDSFSTDNTLKIINMFQTKTYKLKYQGEGKQRSFALSKASKDWILVLDADEVVSFKLKKEILNVISSGKKSGYYIPIQSHYKKRKLNYGGENYKKMILFKRTDGYSTNDEIHAVCKVKNNHLGQLINKLDHFSYISFYQTIKKFTNYAFRVANQKAKNDEKSSLKKLFVYPIHMFYSRFIEDKGYKDGIFRIPLDFAFAYMEFLIYLILFFKSK